ncbi:MAG TPA: DNA primase [Candidatus Paceibacterota bacterium]
MANEVEQIKDRLGIVEVLSSYVKLEKAGANLKARCPFHSEKTPSFFVSPSRNTYYCFGCGVKGDIFSFVQAFEGLDFLGALKLLAPRAGIELEPRDPKVDEERVQLQKILEAATSVYEQGLKTSGEARAYLKKRGVTEATIAKFRVGFVGPMWRSLYDNLHAKGYSDHFLALSGLVKETLKAKSAEGGSPDARSVSKGHYDRFRGRIMFPIADSSGRIVAFSGRLFGERPKRTGAAEGEEAKYVNSPETPLFSKSRILYGFDKAKDSIRRHNFAIVVEGQMDFLLSQQSGFSNTVALSGTALTIDQLTLLNRLSPNVVFAFDADRAGILSSGRSAELALTLGMNVKVASLPAGVDPADLILEDSEKWHHAIKESQHIVDFYLDMLEREGGDLRTLRLRTTNTVLPFVAKITNKVDQAHFVSRIASKLNLPEEPIREELRKIPLSSIPTFQKRVPASTLGRRDLIVRKLIGILLWQEGNKETSIEVSALRSQLVKILGRDPEENFGSEEAKSELLFETEASYLDGTKLAEDIEELLRALTLENIHEELRIATERMRKAEQKGDTSLLETLQKEHQRLTKELMQIS